MPILRACFSLSMTIVCALEAVLECWIGQPITHPRQKSPSALKPSGQARRRLTSASFDQLRRSEIAAAYPNRVAQGQGAAWAHTAPDHLGWRRP